MFETLGKGAMFVEFRVPPGNARLTWIAIRAPSSRTEPENWIVSGPLGVPGSTNTILAFCDLIVVGCPVRRDVSVPVIYRGEQGAESEPVFAGFKDSQTLIVPLNGSPASSNLSTPL